MFPEPRSIVMRGQHATMMRNNPMAAEQEPEVEDASAAAFHANHIQAALRISAALRAAHQDEVEVLSSEAQGPEWTFLVKPLPRPPLVVARMEELDSQELLANDSPGG